MPRGSPRVLSITPHNRYLGIAVFHGPELLIWETKALLKLTRAKKVSAVKKSLERHVEMHGIQVIALKQFPASHHSPTVARITATIQGIARMHKIKVRRYTLPALKRRLLPTKRYPTKKELIYGVLERYPFLFKEFVTLKQSRILYRSLMLEAIAAGCVVAEDVEHLNIFLREVSPQPSSRLRRYRKERGLRQADVAEMLGLVSSARISHWEHGRTLPSMRNAFKLALLYDVMVDAIFYDYRTFLEKEIREARKKFEGKK